MNPSIESNSQATVAPSNASHPHPQAQVHGREYLVSKRGLLKVAELICDIVVIITAGSVCWSAGGWVTFSTCALFYATLFFFILHYKPSPQRDAEQDWPKLEFCFFAGFTLLSIINAIVAVSFAWLDGAVVACTVFAFFAVALYAVDAVFAFIEWRHTKSPTTTTTTTNTNTSTNNNTNTAMAKTVATTETSDARNADPYSNSNMAYLQPPPVYSKHGDLSAY